MKPRSKALKIQSLISAVSHSADTILLWGSSEARSEKRDCIVSWCFSHVCEQDQRKTPGTNYPEIQDISFGSFYFYVLSKLKILRVTER